MMHGHLCRRCGNYWASTAKPDDYRAITVFCPNCIPIVCPAILYGRQGLGTRIA